MATHSEHTGSDHELSLITAAGHSILIVVTLILLAALMLWPFVL